LSPYPTAWTLLDDKKLKIFAVSYSYEHHAYQKGDYVVKGKKELRLYVKDGYLSLEDIQMEGRKRMDIKSFLNGINPQDYSSLFRQ
jgi:methionyl-tRNA formyltransferase